MKSLDLEFYLDIYEKKINMLFFLIMLREGFAGPDGSLLLLM